MASADVHAAVVELARHVARMPGRSAVTTRIVTGRSILASLSQPHVDAALGIEIEALVAVAAVHGDAAAARDEADDRIAGQRLAALREAHEDVVLAARP